MWWRKCWWEMANKLRLPDEVVARLADVGVDLGARVLPDRRRAARGEFADVEIRQVGTLEARDVEGEVGHFVGFSTTYDQPYDVYGGPDRGGFSEIMATGAWKRTIREKVDINLLKNHEGDPFARVGNGTLRLSEPGSGVWNEADLDLRRSDARDLFFALERGDFHKMSCAFVVMRDKWNRDFTERRILEVVGFDSSVVTFPANPHTVAGVEPSTPAAGSGRSLKLARDDWYRLSA